MTRLAASLVIALAVLGLLLNPAGVDRAEVATPAVDGGLESLGPVTLIAAQYGSVVERECSTTITGGSNNAFISPAGAGLTGTFVTASVVFGPDFQEDPGGQVSGTFTGGGSVRVDSSLVSNASCDDGDLVATITGTIDNAGTIDTFTFTVVASD